MYSDLFIQYDSAASLTSKAKPKPKPKSFTYNWVATHNAKPKPKSLTTDNGKRTLQSGHWYSMPTTVQVSSAFQVPIQGYLCHNQQPKIQNNAEESFSNHQL